MTHGDFASLSYGSLPGTDEQYKVTLALGVAGGVEWIIAVIVAVLICRKLRPKDQ